jgi:hypothetical protein
MQCIRKQDIDGMRDVDLPKYTPDFGQCLCCMLCYSGEAVTSEKQIRWCQYEYLDEYLVKNSSVTRHRLVFAEDGSVSSTCLLYDLTKINATRSDKLSRLRIVGLDRSISSNIFPCRIFNAREIKSIRTFLTTASSSFSSRI